MKKKIFGGIAVLAIAAVAAFNLNLNVENKDMSALSVANIEALAAGEDNTSKWFSNLNWAECETITTNGATVIKIGSVYIAAYAKYTVLGSKRVCERELTINSCYIDEQTPCRENY